MYCLFLCYDIPTVDSQTYEIIGAAMEVHRELGCGFLEAVYQEALREELSSRNIPFRAEVEIPIFYKGKRLKTGYRADFVCYESIIVELKAISKLSGIETAQVLNYLRAGHLERGLLFNFGAKSLEQRRFIASSIAL
jgi:GxxExxY protein